MASSAAGQGRETESATAAEQGRMGVSLSSALSLSHDSGPIYMRQLQVQVASVKNRILALLVRVCESSPGWFGSILAGAQVSQQTNKAMARLVLRFVFSAGPFSVSAKKKLSGGKSENTRPSRAPSVAQELVVKSPARLEVKGHTGVVTSSNRCPPPPLSSPPFPPVSHQSATVKESTAGAVTSSTLQILPPALFCMLNTLLVSSAAPKCEGF